MICCAMPGSLGEKFILKILSTSSEECKTIMKFGEVNIAHLNIPQSKHQYR